MNHIPIFIGALKLFCKIAICLLLSALPTSTLIADAKAKEFDISNIHWSKLTYSTSILFFFDLSADVLIELVDSSEIVPTLISTNHGKGLLPKSEKTVLLTMLSNNLGRKSKLDLWLDEELASLQRTQLDTSRRHRRKTFRFLENGVFSLENKPTNKKEKKLPPEYWSKKSENFHAADPEFIGEAVTDDVALFYAISSATNLNKPGDKIEVFTFDKKENYVVTVAAIEYADLEVNYIEESKGNNRIIKEKVPTLKLLLTAYPYKHSDNIETKFLNLKEGIDIYLDQKTRAILQISAKLKYIGRVNIKLDKIILNTSASP